MQNAISDSGATRHFLVQGAPVVNKKPTPSPLKITLPNVKSIQSTHTCNLDIPWLPDALNEAHIVPGISHLSLISTRKFADVGCKVLFDMNECRVHYKGALVLTDKRDEATGLWNIPIKPQEKLTATATIENLDLHIRPNQHVPHEANNVHTLPYLQNRMKYIHQSLLCPPHSTLITAIGNGQLKECPFMTADNVRKIYHLLQKRQREERNGQGQVYVVQDLRKPRRNMKKSSI